MPYEAIGLGSNSIIVVPPNVRKWNLADIGADSANMLSGVSGPKSEARAAL
jgi:hypothetical protein